MLYNLYQRKVGVYFKETIVRVLNNDDRPLFTTLPSLLPKPVFEHWTNIAIHIFSLVER